MSLRDAPESDNKTKQVVYIPTRNLLTPESLTKLMTRISRQEVIVYEQ